MKSENHDRRSREPRMKWNTVYILGIMAELGCLLRCDAGGGVSIGVVRVHIFTDITLYAPQRPVDYVNI